MGATILILPGMLIIIYLLKINGFYEPEHPPWLMIGLLLIGIPGVVCVLALVRCIGAISQLSTAGRSAALIATLVISVLVLMFLCVAAVGIGH